MNNKEPIFEIIKIVQPEPDTKIIARILPDYKELKFEEKKETLDTLKAWIREEYNLLYKKTKNSFQAKIDRARKKYHNRENKNKNK